MVARGKNEADVPLFWSLEVHGESTILKKITWNVILLDFMHYITLHFWETNGRDKSHIFIFLNQVPTVFKSTNLGTLAMLGIQKIF